MLKNISFANGEFVVDTDNINYRTRTVCSEPICEKYVSGKKVRFPIRTSLRIVGLNEKNTEATVVLEGSLHINPIEYVIYTEDLEFIESQNLSQTAIFNNGDYVMKRGDLVRVTQTMTDSTPLKNPITQTYGKVLDMGLKLKICDFNIPDASVSHIEATRLYVDLFNYDSSPYTGVSTLKLDYLVERNAKRNRR